jgi:hypothetical protein
MRGDERDRLGEVDRRAAPEPDDAVAALAPELLDRLERGLLGRVRRDAIEDDARSDAGNAANRRSRSPAAATPRSVTISGRRMPSASRSSAISGSTPAPKRIVVR